MLRYNFSLLLFFICFFAISQSKKNLSYIDLNFFSGNIARHNDDITHLIQDHPNGLILGWNKQVSGKKFWHSLYNYPEYGVSFNTQNFNNDVLGNSFGLFGHYNFYFFKRRLLFRFAQGVSYVTNPYDKISNPKNNAFGSHLLSGSYVMINYKHPKFIGPLALQCGLTLLHLSNGSVKSPNKSLNTIALNIGVSTSISNSFSSKNSISPTKIDSSFKYGVIFRSGINQSDVVGSNQYPFYVFTGYLLKQLNSKSSIVFGMDYFNSKFLKEYIFYQSVAYPENNIDSDLDYKRLGVFIGHELLFGNFSILTDLGHYVYAPFEFEGSIYNRLGFKHHITKSIFFITTLKSHAAKAESLELGIGIKL